MSKTNNRFDLTLPAGWEDQTVYCYAGPYDSGVQHLLTLSVDPKAFSPLSEYARERIDATLDTLTGTEVLKEEEKTLPNGVQAYEVVIRWIPTEDNVIFRKQVYVIFEGKAYCFAANFSKKTIKTVGVEVDRIINSLVPLGEAESD